MTKQLENLFRLHINPLDQTAIHPESYATAKM